MLRDKKKLSKVNRMKSADFISCAGQRMYILHLSARYNKKCELDMFN